MKLSRFALDAFLNTLDSGPAILLLEGFSLPYVVEEELPFTSADTLRIPDEWICAFGRLPWPRV
jgi:hypothetical protein